jgi:non-ribosomal peptide synthetase component F
VWCVDKTGAGDSEGSMHFRTGKHGSTSMLFQHTSSLSHTAGDLCRVVAGGRWRLEGRKDTQVKLNGQRVDLGEVRSISAWHRLSGIV